ncbi:MAG TPA: PhoH family protein [Tepidisphaeraceae bacterium]|jgi:PhoH-like ATPase|nr:PhoH family protein [Tepidisphaeraceae bacterium]
MTHDPIKHFVIDTNVLLHNPNGLFLFAEHEVIIPFDVIEELDKFKTGTDDLGRNARTAIRHLDRLREQGNLADGVPLGPNLGHVRIILEQDQKLCPGLTTDSPDNRMICCAYALSQQGNHVVFISKDINARIKADALGLKAEDFEAQKVDFEKLYTGYRELTVEGSVIDRLYSDKQYPLEIEAEPLLANEFVLLHDSVDEQHTALARYHADTGMIIPVRPRRGPVFGIMPRNVQQTMALDLLLDDSVKLVSLIGNAGTGKTLLAIAAGMTKLLNENIYSKLLAARPIMPLGRDIGYLPGDKDQKLTAWMQPIFDNLVYLLSNRTAGDAGSHPTHETGKSSVEQRIQQLVESGQVVMEPLTYIRGRSIPHQFMIVDEAQNLTPHEVKTIASRVGEGTKLVLTGDATQIDNPYLDASSNGLSYIVERLKGKSLIGHVTLAKSERSELASLVTAEL